MFTKEKFRELWATSRCIPNCDANLSDTPKHIRDKFNELTGMTGYSYCHMIKYFKSRQWPMEKVEGFFDFKKYKHIEDI